ncbi:hypothetical protein BgiBS90_028276 [Biomphalaria glabrata]|nr:hypothetical protein BgiBS90_028276 [Biomphalaria glabrata]
MYLSSESSYILHLYPPFSLSLFVLSCLQAVKRKCYKDWKNYLMESAVPLNFTLTFHVKTPKQGTVTQQKDLDKQTQLDKRKENEAGVDNSAYMQDDDCPKGNNLINGCRKI